MEREKKIAKIYKIVADKTLRFGCLVHWRETPEEVSKVTRVSELTVSVLIRTHTYKDLTKDQKEKEYEIIGHPVMVGDIINRREKNYPSSISLDYGDGSEFATTVLDIVSSFTEKSKSIDEQSDTCVDYVYSLLETNPNAHSCF